MTYLRVLQEELTFTAGRTPEETSYGLRHA